MAIDAAGLHNGSRAHPPCRFAPIQPKQGNHMIRYWMSLLALGAGLSGPALAAELATGPAVGNPGNPGRGELLYSTHCVTCHTEQVHWRDKKIAKTRKQLLVEVRRWQDNANLGWSEADIAEVAGFLDAVHYRFPKPRK